MSKTVALLNTENEATESLPKKVKSGGLYPRWSRREGRMMWLGQFVYKGTKYRTKPCHTKTQAKDALDRLRVAVRQQLHRQTKEKPTFVKFAEEFLEDSRVKNRNYGRNVTSITSLMPFFKDYKLSEIAPEAINRYMVKRLKDGVKPATVNRERSCLSRMFNMTIKLGKATYNPVSQVEKLKEVNKRSRIMTDDEFQKLITVCDTNPSLQVLKAFVIVGRLTCMRRGELLNLKKADVDFTRGRYGIITILKSKSGTPKVIFLSELLSRYLRKLILESASEYVLKFDRSGDVRSRFAKLWRKKLLKKAGVEGLWFHDIRRTGSTVLYESTGDVRAAQTVLDHSTVSTTERYLVVSEESSQEAVDALASGQKIRQILELEMRATLQVQ